MIGRRGFIGLAAAFVVAPLASKPDDVVVLARWTETPFKLTPNEIASFTHGGFVPELPGGRLVQVSERVWTNAEIREWSRSAQRARPDSTPDLLAAPDAAIETKPHLTP